MKGALSFEPTEADGSPRLFVGMHRPPTLPNFAGSGVVFCTCGVHLQFVDGVLNHYQRGCFDRPLYEVRADTAGELPAAVSEGVLAHDADRRR